MMVPEPELMDLRARLQKGRLVGTFLKLPSRAAIEMARDLFDFVVVDREHSSLSEREALELVAHGRALGIPTLLRLPELIAAEVNRALEAGAVGIQLSQTMRASDVEELRSACEYPPLGRRSVSLSHSMAGYGATPLRDYIAHSAGRPLLVAQIESVRTSEPYEQVLRSRPDVAFIGVTDLAVDSEFDDAVQQTSLLAIADATRVAGVTLGAFGLAENPDVRFLIVSSDLTMLRAGMASARQSLVQHSSDQDRNPGGGR